jgi:hypothetical protein
MSFSPNAQQTAIRAAARTRKSGVVNALAGTGKTSTCALVAQDFADEAPEITIAYVAYNADIAEEAKGRFPANTDARTAHSFAYQAIVKPAKAFGRVKNYPTASWEAAKLIGIKGSKTYRVIDETGESVQRVLKPSTLGWIAASTVSRFCRSADLKVTERHVPRPEGFDKLSHARLAADILPFAQTYWTLASSISERGLIMTHDIYLKLFHLSNPRFNVDVILFDEAQDANPVIAAIIALQTHCQVIAVGDPNQAIYGFTGAVNALDSFNAEWKLPLTKTYRFGTAIAETANKFLALLGSENLIEGHDAVASTVVGL